MKLTENTEPKRLRKNLEKKEIWEGRKGAWGSYDDSQSDSCQNVDSWLKYSVIS
ncbi:hypothetical protein BT96DRAFT_918978 [Gymnopus androsaceus JB14]|uniref:Uncharacterized protein n=1 Tax=Gymnopus androsaceus JB14 TaxID=1447944 RepID=A0A6A4HTX4_9AGAR|nr:hypothetical protein BT96DRAFT_918978 [Gymnopus androsaceus JB14]